MSSRQDYNHPRYQVPAPTRKSVVREASSSSGAPRRAVGSQVGVEQKGMHSVMEGIKKYKIVIVGGLAVVVVALAYHFFTKKFALKKDPSQAERGVSALQRIGQGAGQGANSQQPPDLNVENQVIESLSNQVNQYAAQLTEKEYEIQQRDEYIRQLQSQVPQNNAAGANPMQGLHGSLPQQQIPLNTGMGQPVPTREGLPQHLQQQQQQQRGMSSTPFNPTIFGANAPAAQWSSFAEDPVSPQMPQSQGTTVPQSYSPANAQQGMPF